MVTVTFLAMIIVTLLVMVIMDMHMENLKLFMAMDIIRRVMVTDTKQDMIMVIPGMAMDTLLVMVTATK